MSNTSSLPGIRAIFTLPASKISPLVAKMKIATLPTSIAGPLQRIPFTGTPLLTVERKPSNNGTLETAELTFTVRRGDFSVPEVPTAFIVVDIMGYPWLIGTHEEPYPAVTVQDSFGSPSGDSNVMQVKVTYEAEKALIDTVI